MLTGRRKVAGVVAALVALFGALSAAAPPDGIPPQTVQLQSLPSKIGGVIIAPDDTAWCEISSYHVLTPARARERLEKELREQWGSRTPSLTGARPVLFQKSGRIWFSCPCYEKKKLGDVLLAYDGKNFVEPPDHPRTVGIARESAGDVTTPCWNAECAGKSYFITEDGVLAFDGEKLVGVPLGTPAPILYGGRLFPGADGHSLLLLGFNPKTKVSMCFQFREGKWASIEISASLENFDVLPIGTSQLLFWRPANNSGELGAAVTSSIAQKENINALIAQLSDPAYDKRRAASEELRAAGPLILPKLIAASHVAVDDESQARLRDIIAGAAPTAPETRIGPYKAAGIYGAAGDAQGRAFISATGVTENNRVLGDGLIIGDGTQWDFLSNTSVFEGVLKPSPRGTQAFQPLICGGDLWLHDYRSDHPNGLRRLNIAKRRLDPPIPRNDLKWIFGVQQNGAVYAGISQQGALGNSEVVVYRADLPAVAQPGLPVITRELWGLECGPDGKLWACDVGAKALMYFDGTAWKARATISGSVQSYAVGVNDVVIVKTREELPAKASVELITAHETETAADLQTLIEKHGSEIAAAFGDSQVSNADDYDVVADAKQNIWLRTGRMLQVFSGGKWLPVKTPEGAGEMRMLPTDDSPTIVCGENDGRWQAFTASISHGKPDLEPWPPRTRNGNAFPGNYPRSAAAAECLRDGQISATFDGTLAFDDGVGHSWTQGHRAGKIALFRDGKNVGTLEVPGLPEYWHGATDHAGSVYLLTAVGLEHWAYDKAIAGAPFTRRETYAIPTLPKQVIAMTCSKLGYLAIWGMSDRPPGSVDGTYRHDVLLIKLADMQKGSAAGPAKNKKQN